MRKLFAILMVFCLVAGAGLMQPVVAGAEDTSFFDGGSGSTSNTSYSSSSSVPDVGPSGPVGYYDADMNYHSNS